MEQEIFSTVNYYIRNPVERYWDWNTVITEYENGVVDRRQRWTRPRRRWKFAWSLMNEEQRNEVISFFNSAAMGQAKVFLLKDPFDHSAVCSFTGDGTTTEFQLYKDYYDAWREYKTRIDVTSVAVSCSESLPSYIISEYGMLTFSSPPQNGVEFSVSYDFYFRVSSNSDTLTDTKVAPSLWEYHDWELVEVL